MSYNKKQFAEKMISEIQDLHNAGFVYQSMNGLATINNFARVHCGLILFKNIFINRLFENWSLNYSPQGMVWISEDSKKNMKIYKKRLTVCPQKLINEARKELSKIKADKNIFLLVDKPVKKLKK